MIHIEAAWPWTKCPEVEKVCYKYGELVILFQGSLIARHVIRSLCHWCIFCSFCRSSCLFVCPTKSWWALCQRSLCIITLFFASNDFSVGHELYNLWGCWQSFIRKVIRLHFSKGFPQFCRGTCNSCRRPISCVWYNTDLLCVIQYWWHQDHGLQMLATALYIAIFPQK